MSPAAAGASHIVVESPRLRVSVEIETMTKGVPKVTVRVDDDDPDVAANETLRIYRNLAAELAADMPAV